MVLGIFGLDLDGFFEGITGALQRAGLQMRDAEFGKRLRRPLANRFRSGFDLQRRPEAFGGLFEAPVLQHFVPAFHEFAETFGTGERCRENGQQDGDGQK